MEKYFVTTPIYYINDKPHIGHTYTTVAADILARYHRLLGKDVFFLTGTDENAQKTVEAAEKEGQDIQKCADSMSNLWEDTWKGLKITNDGFIRTTSENHKEGVKKFFKRVYKNGDIYKGLYEGLYCVGCEAFITEKELVDGCCPAHKRKPEILNEENYFFKLSKYKNLLLRLYEENPNFIQPKSRRNEIINYVQEHLKDISISRQSLKWGITFPIDKTHKFYVWFDALLNYLTGIGYGWDDELFKKYWPADLHLMAKDIIKFHCAIWPAMLLSAGLELPKRIFAHGFFTLNGEKISKSLGNIIDPLDLKKDYGFDAIRYFLFAEIPFGSDGDFSEKRLKERYNADLANGLGNLIARVAKLCEISQAEFPHPLPMQFDEKYKEYMENLRFSEALKHIWYYVGGISAQDKQINEARIWELKGEQLHEALRPLVTGIRRIAHHLKPFMPETAERIEKQFKGPKVKSAKPLFPRI